jgi:hypothetical protein
MTDLRERVAQKLLEASGGHINAAADAAIAVVVDDCAKEADKRGHVTSADAIRALAKGNDDAPL